MSRKIVPCRRYSLPALASLLAAAFAVSGCAVGPDFHHPTPPQVSGYTPEPLPPQTSATATPGGEAQRFVTDMDIPGQWWTLFQSAPLDALVAEALRNNHDLKAAQAALRSAQETLKAQSAAYYPSADANWNFNRQKDATATLASIETSGLTYFSLHTGQLNIAYSPDLFGLNRRTVEGLKAQAQAQRFQAEATYLSLTSNVVVAAVTEAALRGQIQATEETIATQIRLFDLIRKQESLGQAADGDVAAQAAALAQAQAALPPLRKQLDQQRDLIAVLVGRYPSDAPDTRFDLDRIALPRDLPVSLPSKLVWQRPDVRAAEENLHAANAAVGVAIANRLPNITLTGNYGTTALSLDKLFKPGSEFWTIGPNVALPIFDGGALRHKQRAAEAARDQALEEYRATLLSAFQNVGDALAALRHDADGLQTSLAAERASHRSLELAQAQVALGAVDDLALLNAEQAYQQARLGVIEAKAARLADTAGLFQALGGGWWNRSDLEPASAQQAPPRRHPEKGALQ